MLIRLFRSVVILSELTYVAYLEPDLCFRSIISWILLTLNSYEPLYKHMRITLGLQLPCSTCLGEHMMWPPSPG